MHRSLILARCPRVLALLLAFLVLCTVSQAAGAHHDHDSGHHAGCPSCRLADGSAGTLPVADSKTVILPAADPFRPVPVERTTSTPHAPTAHHLRAPPVID